MLPINKEDIGTLDSFANLILKIFSRDNFPAFAFLFSIGTVFFLANIFTKEINYVRMDNAEKNLLIMDIIQSKIGLLNNHEQCLVILNSIKSEEHSKKIRFLSEQCENDINKLNKHIEQINNKTLLFKHQKYIKKSFYEK